MNKVAIFLTLMMLAAISLVLFIGGKVPESGSMTIKGNYLSGGRIPEANGSTTHTIKLLDANEAAEKFDKPIKLKNSSNRHLNTEVTLKVEQGSVRLELLGNREQPTASVVATPGKPASVKGYWIADASGEFKFRIIGTEAKNIRYSFSSHFD